MVRFAEFIRKNYQTIIIATVIVGLPVALAFILQMLTASTFYRYLIRQAGRADAPGRMVS